MEPIFGHRLPVSCEAVDARTYKMDDNLEIAMNPPLLISMPGSGSLLLRQLLEYSSQLYSGSLGFMNAIEDPDLLKRFKYESSCGQRMGFIWCSDPSLIHINSEGTIGFNHRYQRKKCRRGVLTTINSAIILVRNPYNAIWDSYKSLHAHHQNASWTQFAHKASLLYADFWNEIISKIVHSLAGKVLVVRYEDLVDGSPSSINLLHRLTSFIVREPNSTLCVGHEVVGFRWPVTSCSSKLQADRSRIKCAVSMTVASFGEENNSGRERQSGGQVLINYDVNWKNYYDSALLANISANLYTFLHAFGYENQLSMDSPYMSTESRIAPINEFNNQSKTISLIHCLRRYGPRSFYSTDQPLQTIIPTMLLSFPGSGNTWTRLILEYTTGIYSGSADVADKSLRAEFIGEAFCDQSQLIIKVHPDGVRFIPNSTFPSVILKYPEQYAKCVKGGIHGFEKVLFLVRNPLDAILAEFQRANTKSHVGSFTVHDFPMKLWLQQSIGQAKQYQQFWAENLLPMLTSLSSMSSQKLLIVRYESLVSISTRSAELQRMVNFLLENNDSDNNYLNDSYKQHNNLRPSSDRIDCAFELSRSSKVLRGKSADTVTPQYVYKNATHVDLLWGYIKHFAVYFGYDRLK